MDHRASLATLRRSVSNSNLKTPKSSRPTLNLNRSPARTTPNWNNDQNRKQIAENSHKVMEILQMDNVFFGRINLINGLKSMTAKQFIDIIGHFSIKISGKNMIIPQNVTNGKPKSTPEVEILAFLQMLNYPYVINKSCLRTPNTQHTFKECVFLLAWLSDIVRYSQKDDLTELPMNDGNQFPNERYTKHFSLEIQNAYRTWNEESDEAFRTIIDGLVETFVKAKRDCISSEKIIQKVNELKKANVKLLQAQMATDYIDDNAKAFEAIQSKYYELKEEFKELKIYNGGRIETINRLNLLYKLKANEAKEKNEAFNALFYQIDKQKYTKADIKRISDKILLIQKVIVSANQEIEQIRENASDLQIKVARLKQQRNAIISDLNGIAIKIAQILAKSQDYKNSVNVNDFCLDIMADTDTIQMVCQRFECIYDNVMAHKKQIYHKINQQNVKLSTLHTQIDRLESEVKNLIGKFQKCNQNLDTANEKIMQYQSESQHLFVKLLPGTLNMEHEELIKEMAEKRKTIIILEAENLKILEDGENCIYKCIEAKHNALESLNNVSKLLDDVKSKN